MVLPSSRNTTPLAVTSQARVRRCNSKWKFIEEAARAAYICLVGAFIISCWAHFKSVSLKGCSGNIVGSPAGPTESLKGMGVCKRLFVHSQVIEASWSWKNSCKHLDSKRLSFDVLAFRWLLRIAWAQNASTMLSDFHMGRTCLVAPLKLVNPKTFFRVNELVKFAGRSVACAR